MWFWNFIETNSPFFIIIQIFWFVGLVVRLAMLKLTDSSLCSELQACLNMTVGRVLFFCLDTKEPKDQNCLLRKLLRCSS
jgi:hypothetical protein